MSLKEKVLLRKIKNRERKKLDLLKTREDYTKLIVLVEARPELYDTTRKDYHNQDAITKAWQSISEEMNVSNYECKSKWHTLRSSYGRYLRDLERKSGGRRQKWYLADAMSFLLPYLTPQRKKSIKHKEDMTIKHEEDRTNEEFADEFVVELEGEVSDEIGDHEIETSITNDHLTDLEEISFKKRKNRTATESKNMNYYGCSSGSSMRAAYEHPVLMFFRSLMPDVEKLSQTSQRRFKTDILHSLNFYLDNQEDDESSQFAFSGPSSNNSVSGSNQSALMNDELHLQDVRCVMEIT